MSILPSSLLENHSQSIALAASKNTGNAPDNQSLMGPDLDLSLNIS